jgi:hypothetical protein
MIRHHPLDIKLLSALRDGLGAFSGGRNSDVGPVEVDLRGQFPATELVFRFSVRRRPIGWSVTAWDPDDLADLERADENSVVRSVANVWLANLLELLDGLERPSARVKLSDPDFTGRQWLQEDDP